MRRPSSVGDHGLASAARTARRRSGRRARRTKTLHPLPRAPDAARILVLAEEVQATGSSGYRLEMDCSYFDGPRRLLPRIQEEIRAAIARPFLESNELDSWDLGGNEVGGYLEDDLGSEGHGSPCVLIDGHSLSWQEFELVLRQYAG